MADAGQLDGRLRAIEEAAARIDAGDPAAAAEVAEALTAIFQGAAGAPSLLSQLGGTFVKIASSVPKPPYPHGKFAPLTDVLIDLGGDPVRAATGQSAGFPPPTFRARLGPPRALRFVQAPDWWKAEPAFLVDHSKATRRDVVHAALGATDGGASHLADLLQKAQWTGLTVSPFGEAARVVPVRAVSAAAVRQVAHEVLSSPDLLALAGRPAKKAWA